MHPDGHSRQSLLRVLLVLARISNLPTVWSNCLAAWLLVGGADWARLLLACLGASLLYTGGMFLNDAVDQEFDRRFRSERPIASGRISARAVWLLAWLWLLAGWIVFLCLGPASAVFAGALMLAIVLYDLLHKRTIFAPLLMALCRFLLYPLAASVAHSGSLPNVFGPAAALAAYIVGLSYLARGESTGARHLRWTLVLLFLPVIVKFLGASGVGWSLLLASAVQLGWTLWCLLGRTPPWLRFVPRHVAGLLAGIVLVDWVAAAGLLSGAVFITLFISAILLQRLAPAT